MGIIRAGYVESAIAYVLALRDVSIVIVLIYINHERLIAEKKEL